MASERKFVKENIRRVLLKEYIRKETERAGFGGLDIQRTPMGTRVILTAERPGMIIGRKGTAIKELTENIESRFSFDNPRIEVQEDPEPALNPHIMAQKLASALERGWHFRRAGHSTVRRIMESGARGCQVIISGKLTGERHRTEKFREGHIKYCGEPKKIWMKEGFAVAKKKPGVIGVKVQIMDKDARLPDEVRILALEDKLKVEGVEPPVEVAEGTDAEAAEGAKAEPAEKTKEVKPETEVEEAEEGVEEGEEEDEEALGKLKGKDKKRISKRKEKRRERSKKKEETKKEGEEEDVKKKEEKKEEKKVEEKVEEKEATPPAPTKEKTEATPEVKPEKKAEEKVEPKVEVKTEEKVEVKAEVKAPEKATEAAPEEKEKGKEKKKDSLDELLAKLEDDLKG